MVKTDGTAAEKTVMILSQIDTDRLINAESFENGNSKFVPEFLTKACLSSMLELMQKNLLTDTKGYYKNK